MDVDTRDRILMPQQSQSISVRGEGLGDLRASAFHQYSEPCSLVMWRKGHENNVNRCIHNLHRKGREYLGICINVLCNNLLRNSIQ